MITRFIESSQVSEQTSGLEIEPTLRPPIISILSTHNRIEQAEPEIQYQMMARLVRRTRPSLTLKLETTTNLQHKPTIAISPVPKYHKK